MSTDFRTCDACGVRVQRSQVHKNRYGQYICRQCRASGVRAVGTHSVRAFASRIPVVAAGMVGLLLVVVLLVVVALVASELPSLSSGGVIEAVKEIVRSLNQMVRAP